MNTIIVPGYGDTSWYIRAATLFWPLTHGLKPDIQVFGWEGESGTYDAKWERFDNHLKQIGETAIIGISAGASVALRALAEHPDKVKKVITICGPASEKGLNLAKYPVLEESFRNLTLSDVPADRIMTMRPVYDDVVDIRSMLIEGATDFNLGTSKHARSIAQAIFTRGNEFEDFIKAA